MFSSCKVDKDYSLKDKNMDYKINAGSQVIVPIGNFSRIRINSLLTEDAREYFIKDEDSNFVYDPAGEILTNFELGHYELHGLSFVDLSDFGVPAIKFFITFNNTLPFDFELSCYVIDSLRNKIPNVAAILDDITVPSGSEESPGLATGIVRIEPGQTSGFGFDGICIKLLVRKMPETSFLIDKHRGLALKNVKLQLPQGINFRVRKTDDSAEE